MKVWMVFLQGDDTTWLEVAWDDDSTAENPSGWKDAVDHAREMARNNGYEMRIMAVEVPRVYETFEIPNVKASSA